MRLPKLFNKIKIISACGRTCLLVNGFVVAMEGDLCRDMELSGIFGRNRWNIDMMEHVKHNRA